MWQKQKFGVMSRRAIAKKVLSPELTIVAIVVCKRIRSSRVKEVTFNSLHNMLCLPYLTMILILVIRNNSPNNSLDFTRRKGL